MPNARIPLADRLVAALAKNDIPSEREHVNPSSTTVDFVAPPGDGAPLDIQALVIDDRFIALYVDPRIVVPGERMQDALAWAHEMNTTLFVGTVELDVEDGEIGFRHTVDCNPIPPAALDACLKEAWTLAATVWTSAAETLLPLLDTGARAPAPRDMSWSAAGDVDGDDRAHEDDVQQLFDVMYAAVAERFGDDVADALSGTMTDVAETFLAHVDEADVDDVEAEARAKGSDERAVLAVSAPGVKPIRLRFSPATLRQRLAQDAGGLTLLHHTTADRARRILGEGFVDTVIPVRVAYSLDHNGVPTGDEEGDDLEAVLLTDRPLPPDDRRHLSVTLQVKWDLDAPPLYFYEHAETAYEGTEASVVEQSIRRWHVPADVINAAVHDGLAEVAIVSDRLS
jgi:hypothetical protein